MRLLIIFILFFVGLTASFGQTGRAKGALKQLRKGNFEKAVGLIDKALEKDSLLPANLYARSRTFLDTTNTDPNIDSAYLYILLAAYHYPMIEEKERKKHIKVGIDSLAILLQKQKIDSAAFLRAYSINTEEGFIDFISRFTTARQLSRAVFLRNELAYATARSENTFQSYRQFMEKYPEAVQVQEAKRRYEKLYFDKSTSDGKLNSYLKFLNDNPQTPYRTEAEESIYEVMTADNSANSYLGFIKQFPASQIKSRAVDFLYHVLKEQGKTLPGSLFSDSLKYIASKEGKVLVPVWTNKLYGFIDAQGNEVIPPRHTHIKSDELCGNIQRDYFMLESNIIGLDGSEIFRGAYSEVDDLGYGLLKITNRGKSGLVHKSGRGILPINNDDVKLLAGKFVAFKRSGRWGLRTISGREIVAPRFDAIFEQGPFVFFEDKDKIDIQIETALVMAVDNNQLNIRLRFTDFELVNERHLWLKNSTEEVVIDHNLHEIIPMAPQKIKILKKGFLIERANQFYVLDEMYRPIDKEAATYASNNEAWVTLKNSNGWLLYDLNDYAIKDQKIDSLALLGQYYALSFRNDSIAIITDGLSIILNSDERVSLLSERNSDQYILIQSAKKQRIINRQGKVVFSGKFDDAKPLGREYLLITSNGKKGIISADAEMLLKMEYDAIGNYDSGYVSLLKNKKFGLYNHKASVFISSEYDKNIVRYNAGFFIGEKANKMGFISKGNKPVSAFEYDEISYWSDTVALVKKDNLWSLFNLFTGEVIDKEIKSFQIILQNPIETLAIILKNGGYGVLSSSRGEIISPTYNDIVNIGTKGRPVYFTEKHISEAEFYVVIYYDNQGQVIRKQAFESRDYPQIYCDN